MTLSKHIEIEFPLGKTVCVVTAKQTLEIKGDRILLEKDADDSLTLYLSIFYAGQVVGWFDTFHGWYLQDSK